MPIQRAQSAKKPQTDLNRQDRQCGRHCKNWADRHLTMAQLWLMVGLVSHDLKGAYMWSVGQMGPHGTMIGPGLHISNLIFSVLAIKSHKRLLGHLCLVWSLFIATPLMCVSFQFVTFSILFLSITLTAWLNFFEKTWLSSYPHRCSTDHDREPTKVQHKIILWFPPRN